MGLGLDLFEGEISDDLICRICEQVFDDPVSNVCPHVFCYGCIQKRLLHKSSRVCPLCHVTLNPTPQRPPNTITAKLLRLRISCRKCGTFCELQQLPHHLNQECPKTEISCPNLKIGCKELTQRAKINKHLKKCLYRIVTCEGCGLKMLYHKLFLHQKKTKCYDIKLKQEVIKSMNSANKQVKVHTLQLRDDVYLYKQQQKRHIDEVMRARRYSSSSGGYSPRSLSSSSSSSIMTGISSSDGNWETRYPYRPPSAKSESSGYMSFRTPFPSRASGAVMICQRCDKFYIDSRNTETSCTFHRGPIYTLFGGTCEFCGRLNSQPGCMQSYHQC